MKIGTDILEISRVTKSLAQGDFKTRVFSKNEIEYASKFNNSAEHFTGFFCAKEAIVKAFGEGNIVEIEILHEVSGKPYPMFSGKTRLIAHQYKDISISISHCKSYAVAVAICSK